MQEKIGLKKILEQIDWRLIPSASSAQISDFEIDNVSADSRKVGSKSVFVARRGVKSDGHDFIKASLASGCRVIVVEDQFLPDSNYEQLDALVFGVKNSDISYAEMQANLWGHPAKNLKLIAITGTNGKTTISYLLEDLLTKLGMQTGVIGTVNNRYYNSNSKLISIHTEHTTPDAGVIQPLLKEMVGAGVKVVIMEISSHAISQARIAPLMFDLAIFTNLSRDHLDYHSDMDSYFAAKYILFEKYLKEDGKAVIPGDTRSLANPYLNELQELLGDRYIDWGESESCKLRLSEHSEKLDATDFSVEVVEASKTVDLSTRLVGRFNIDNMLSTLGSALALGYGLEELKVILPELQGAPGRLERIVTGSNENLEEPVVFVDYAHTPDALEKVLSTLVEIPHGNLLTVFGCGGDRDKGKRPLMGSVAAKYSDVVVVTEDNPRTEDSKAILKDIVAGIGEKEYLLIPSRKEAIAKAIGMAKAGDIVVLAGKGHENYQITENGKNFFDDSIVARNVLSSWTVTRIAEATRGQIKSSTDKSIYLGTVNTDTRTIKENDIFVALRGESFDGHNFLQQALNQGASCLVVEKYYPDITCTQIIVADTGMALGDMASYRKDAILPKGLKCVGITGSSGKTTVKEMVGSIFSCNWPAGDYAEDAILKTAGNFNNLVGLPLSLLPLGFQHQAVILEMGMNSPGEIARLTAIAKPDVVCINNVQGAHLSGLGSIEGVASAKEEIFLEAKESTIFSVNLDDALVTERASKYQNKKIYYSLSKKSQSDVWASDVKSEGLNNISFNLHYQEEIVCVVLPAIGEHNINNALAAASISIAMGLKLPVIASGLAKFVNQSKRMELLTSKSGWNIISDCYNANPASMMTGLKTLVSIKTGKRIAVLGDMFELGEDAERAHIRIGEFAGSLALDLILVVGEFASLVKIAAEESGMKGRAFAFSDKSDIVDLLKNLQERQELLTGDTVFVKGSRGMTMETIISEFI
ncbi:MAG: UDP-N-acetylmuramoyl-L-alanyl-D-glutamate--2,6-diaminopimelate ligase [Desulfotalea sp.]